jgi:alpha-1,3-fucosyltransferase
MMKIDEMMERDYKFYLAFENAICPDYVTEKFYNTLLFSTVPIVYGGADYEAIRAPPNSHIDVRNFTSGIQNMSLYYYYYQVYLLLFDAC